MQSSTGGSFSALAGGATDAADYAPDLDARRLFQSARARGLQFFQMVNQRRIFALALVALRFDRS